MNLIEEVSEALGFDIRMLDQMECREAVRLFKNAIQNPRATAEAKTYLKKMVIELEKGSQGEPVSWVQKAPEPIDLSFPTSFKF